MNLNIFQSNQFNNYDINDTKLTDVNQTKAAMQILGELSDIMPGTTLTGQLVGKDGTSLSLLLQNNVSLNTSLESDANIMTGQILNFEVTGNDKGHLTVRPLHTNMANEETITRALDNAGIRINNATIDMVDGLMREGMPINKETLMQYNRYINTYPQADIKDIIMLNKMNIPLNQDNVEQMHLYNNNNQWMMDNLSEFTDNLTECLAQIADETPEKFHEFVNELKNILGVPNENDAQTNIIDNSKMPDAEEKTITANRENTMQTGNKDASDTVIRDNTDDKNQKDIFEILKNIEPAKLKNTKVLQHIRNDMNEVLSKALLMEPKETADKEYVSRYYERIHEMTKNIEQLLNNNNKADSSLAKDVSNIKNNVNFMNQINEMYNYVQLPLKMADQHANGELYVYTKKKNKQNQDEPLTALLHLSMEYLGNMDIFLKLDNGKLSTKFCLEKEENIDFIESHIDELNKRLVDKGYNSEIKVSQMDNSRDNVIDTIRNEKNGVLILSEKGFDARA